MRMPLYWTELLGTSRKSYWRLRSRNRKVLAVSETMSRRAAIEVTRKLECAHGISAIMGEVVPVAKNSRRRRGVAT